MLAKVKSGEHDMEYNYTGRIADRQTEDDYTTENLMTVSLSVTNFSTIKNLLTRQLYSLKEVLGVTDAFRMQERTMALKTLMVEVEAMGETYISERHVAFRICTN